MVMIYFVCIYLYDNIFLYTKIFYLFSFFIHLFVFFIFLIFNTFSLKVSIWWRWKDQGRSIKTYVGYVGLM